MPILTNFHLQPEDAELFYKSVVVRPGFWGDKADKKDVIYRKRNFEPLITQSAFPVVAELWNALADSIKDRWASAGYWSGQTGWELFSQDTNYRVNNGILGIGEANLYHQFMVGKITPGGANGEIKITQPIQMQIPGDFSFYINAISKLTSMGAGSFAKFILTISFHDPADDPGEIVTYDYEYDLSDLLWWGYVGDTWPYADVTDISASLSIHIYKMTGSLYIDGVEFNFNDVNHIKDFQCNEIENNWLPVIGPVGSDFRSVYSRNSFYQ
ncbi:MAG: hypothetical protein ACD_9C00239G0003 [uncultured bacterium]|nr:MAG: hypothetical protein ACD_9C00239G0003 [uncultured bacterium]